MLIVARQSLASWQRTNGVLIVFNIVCHFSFSFGAWRVTVLEHGSEKYRQVIVDHLINGLLDYATHEQGYKSVTKALEHGAKDMFDRVVNKICEVGKVYTSGFATTLSIIPKRFAVSCIYANVAELCTDIGLHVEDGIGLLLERCITKSIQQNT